MTKTRRLSHAECLEAGFEMAKHITERRTVYQKNSSHPIIYVYPVPRGGVPVGYLLQAHPNIAVTDDTSKANLIVDDIIDSGRTQEHFRLLYPGKPFLALTDFLSEKHVKGQWIVFPWEESFNKGGDTSAEDSVVRLLQYIGEDPTRDGLLDTPKRVLKAWKEMTVGYQQDPKQLLSRDFESKNYDEIIACPWIEFFSTCEHHLLPFVGSAHVAYLPSKKSRVVGLSKLARLVDCYARRLQIQEQMTIQIADALETHLKARGVAVVLQAKHMCMACRGVQKNKSTMVTSAMRGVFRTNPAARTEFFSLIGLAHNKTILA